MFIKRPTARPAGRPARPQTHPSMLAAMLRTRAAHRATFASSRAFASSVLSWGRGVFGALGDGTYDHRVRTLSLHFHWSSLRFSHLHHHTI